MRSGKHDADAASNFLNIEHQSSDAIADAVILAANALRPGENAFAAA
jgi:hypothetical protein